MTSTHPGDALFDIVETYTALGWHRTGSDVDRRTAAWFADELSRRGLDVRSETVAFDRWVAESGLRVDGEDVEHLALQTAWVGEVAVDHPMVVSIDPHHGGFPAVVDGPIREAIARGADALIISTEHPDGSLVGINREPEVDGTPPFPVVLVAGRDFERCRQGNVRLDLRARRMPGETTNVVASRPGRGRPVMVTTPLTGWFGCAGERGTGIAVLLDVIDRLPEVALSVVATGGHELGFFGADRYVDGLVEVPAAVLHLGASIAVEEIDPEEGRRLASTRVAMTTIDAGSGAPIAAALDRARLPVLFESERWIGEATAWRRLDVPILSISGAGVDFHTPEDTPGRVTSPSALALAADAVVDAAGEFLTVVGLA